MRNYSLDFFRGLAASLVCIGHLYFWNNNTDSISIAFILAVDFFLVLSGFVIAQSIFNKMNFSIPIFIANRWIRLFPVFIICFLLIGIPKIIFIEYYILPNFSDLTKYFIIGHMLPINLDTQFKDPLSIAYTISAEFWVGIILFPCIYFLSNSKRVLFLLAIFIFSYLNIILYSPNFLDIHYQFFNKYLYFGIIRCLADYSLGIITYLLYTKFKNHDININIISTLQTLIIVLLIVIYSNINYNRNFDYLAPFLFSLFIISISFNKGFINKITNNKYGEFSGKISYPIYLIHPLYVGIFSLLKFPINFFNVCIYLLLCIITSWVIHTLIEKPMMKLMIKN